MPIGLKRLLFALFVASGFCGLLYQIVWIRMALSSFGVITPIVSVVVSVFMLGLSVGTWLGGRWSERLATGSGMKPLTAYGIAEITIGLSAFVLPWLFDVGRDLLVDVGDFDSGQYLLMSSLVILAAMLPWCVAMGATLPLMMGFVRTVDRRDTESFSFLYLGNVVGAMVGTLVTSLVLIELVGFSTSLWIAGGLNFAIGLVAFALSRRMSTEPVQPVRTKQDTATAPAPQEGIRKGTTVCAILFGTGFISMALEIMWMRAFTPVLGQLVYAFSGVLAAYLLATWVGSLTYRRASARGRTRSVASLVAVAAVSCLLPIVFADPHWLVKASRAAEYLTLTSVPAYLFRPPLLVLTIFPFCWALGYLTPMLVDRYSQGDPDRAGVAYSVNIVGSILGPLAAAYLFLPTIGPRMAMVVLALPFAALFVAFLVRRRDAIPRVWAVTTGVLILCGLGQAAFRTQAYDEGVMYEDREVRRDHTATVISHGKGLKSHLLVNGHGMTTLTTLTKVMAHFPLATFERPPERACIIAFGMGTTYRSMLQWDVETTAVELVPSVVDAFGYYFEDADVWRNHPKGHIVVDDGRRFLARSDEIFDLITIDPPPPVESAGSSMLYSTRMYELAKPRLAKDGILLQWFPDNPSVEPAIRHAVVRSATTTFDHVRVFRSFRGWGLHIFCSQVPIEIPDAKTLVARMPQAAREDLMAWEGGVEKIEEFFRDRVLGREIPLEEILDGASDTVVSDDHPFNEYFLVRRLLGL